MMHVGWTLSIAVVDANVRGEARSQNPRSTIGRIAKYDFPCRLPIIRNFFIFVGL